MSVTLANGGDQTKRRELDFYPTPPEVTHALMDFLRPKPTVIWEPACGNGAMAEALKAHGHDVIATDIRHTGYGDGGIDFLSAAGIECGAIITNPPFNLSEMFIRKAISCAPIVAMVLKSQYWHAQKRVKLFQDLPPAWVLPLTWRPDFLFDQRADGQRAAPTMDCIWTVWVGGVSDTRYCPMERPKPRQQDPEPDRSGRQLDIFTHVSSGSITAPVVTKEAA